MSSDEEIGRQEAERVAKAAQAQVKREIAAVKANVAEIADLCELSGFPRIAAEHIASFIGGKKTVAQIRAELADQKQKALTRRAMYG